MKKTAIFYGTSTGNTQSVAESINTHLDNQAELINVEDAKDASVDNYDFLFLGTSTWGFGDLQDDWEGFISDLASANLEGKKVALFGLGDAEAYADTFVDGMGIIYNAIASKGCEVVGMVSVDGYRFDASAATVDEKFVGLPLDEDNESNRTEDRVAMWMKNIRPHLD